MALSKKTSDGALKDRPWRIIVSLVIRKFGCLPEDITSLLGIGADKTWKKGDKVTEKAALCWKWNGWQISGADDLETRSISDQIETIRTRVDTAIDRFKAL